MPNNKVVDASISDLPEKRLCSTPSFHLFQTNEHDGLGSKVRAKLWAKNHLTFATLPASNAARLVLNDKPVYALQINRFQGLIRLR